MRGEGKSGHRSRTGIANFSSKTEEKIEMKLIFEKPMKIVLILCEDQMRRDCLKSKNCNV